MRIKVLHVVYSLDPGGMENGIINMANMLPVDEFEIAVLCLDHVGGMVERLNRSVQVFEVSKADGFDCKLIPKILKVLKEFKPNVIHTHNLGPLIYLALCVFSRDNYSLIHGEHASLTKVDLSVKKKIQRRALYSLVSCLHTVGLGMSRQMRELGFTKWRINTLTNGVNVEYFNMQKTVSLKDRELQDFVRGKFVVTIVGRFGKYKGHDKLLEAFEIIRRNRSDVGLLIVGGGGEMSKYVKNLIAKHPHRGDIFLTGYREDTRPYYLLSDLLVVVSENEGLSNCILESMACGTPVLSSKSCGANELIYHGYNGFLLEMNTPQCISDSVSRLLYGNDVDLRQIAEVAREHVYAKFTLQMMRSRYHSLYDYYGVDVCLN